MKNLIQINPLDSDYWGVPLIGIAPDGTETKVRVNNKSGKPCVWGWSVFGGVGGYRTLGTSVDEMINIRHWKFYKESECETCHKGTMREMSIYDDMDGMLTCDKCGVRTKN